MWVREQGRAKKVPEKQTYNATGEGQTGRQEYWRLQTWGFTMAKGPARGDFAGLVSELRTLWLHPGNCYMTLITSPSPLLSFKFHGYKWDHIMVSLSDISTEPFAPTEESMTRLGADLVEAGWASWDSGISVPSSGNPDTVMGCAAQPTVGLSYFHVNLKRKASLSSWRF